MRVHGKGCFACLSSLGRLQAELSSAILRRDLLRTGPRVLCLDRVNFDNRGIHWFLWEGSASAKHIRTGCAVPDGETIVGRDVTDVCLLAAFLFGVAIFNKGKPFLN